MTTSFGEESATPPPVTSVPAGHVTWLLWMLCGWTETVFFTYVILNGSPAWADAATASRTLISVPTTRNGRFPGRVYAPPFVDSRRAPSVEAEAEGPDVQRRCRGIGLHLPSRARPVPAELHRRRPAQRI